VEHVSAYSHSNRWVGVSGACGDEWIVTGEIRGGQGIRDYRRGPFNWFNVSETKAKQAFEELAKHAEQIKKHAASVLNRVANAAKQAGVSCDTIQVKDEQPYKTIIATAADRGCDLIVMASHGRSGLSAVVLGSVTNKVLTHTKTPVLVCH
jgi:nucleotide-binding universal stress UspA family protein